MNWKKVPKQRRNERLKVFAARHPDMTQEAIAKIFHISQVRVSQILNNGGKEA